MANDSLLFKKKLKFTVALAFSTLFFLITISGAMAAQFLEIGDASKDMWYIGNTFTTGSFPQGFDQEITPAFVYDTGRLEPTNSIANQLFGETHSLPINDPNGNQAINVTMCWDYTSRLAEAYGYMGFANATTSIQNPQEGPNVAAVGYETNSGRFMNCTGTTCNLIDSGISGGSGNYCISVNTTHVTLIKDAVEQKVTRHGHAGITEAFMYIAYRNDVVDHWVDNLFANSTGNSIFVPVFTTVVNNATLRTETGETVNWTTTISIGAGNLDFCWFTHNDSGSFVNLSVQRCTTPIVWSANVTITAGTGKLVCGFFGANSTLPLEDRTDDSCFVVGEKISPTFTGATNNATSTLINDVVQFNITMNDNFALGHYTFGFNNSGSFVNDTEVILSGTTIFVQKNKTINENPNLFICGRYYFNDTSGNEDQSESCFTTSNLIRINITPRHALNNNSINTFTATVDTTIVTSTSGLAQFQVSSGSHSLNISATGFSSLITTITVSSTNKEFNLSLFPDPSSISVTILQETDDVIINFQNVNINLLGTTQDINFSISTGTIFIGNLTADNYELDISSFGFTTRTYFINLPSVSHVNLVARLLNTSETGTQEITFTVQDQSGRLLEGSTITVAKRINASFFSVGQKDTDISGQAVFTLDSTVRYQLTIEAFDFTTRQFELTPTSTTYTIVLQELGQLNFTTLFDIVTYRTTPTSGILLPNIQEFTFSISSPTGSIQYFWFNISVENSISNFTNITGSPSGGTITLFLNLTGFEGQSVIGQYAIQVVGFPLFLFNKTWSVGSNITPGNFSLVQIEEDFGDEFSGNMRGFLVTIISAAIAVTIAAMAGSGLAGGLAGVVIIGMFAAIGWIPLWQVGLFFLISISVYLFLGKRGAD